MNKLKVSVFWLIVFCCFLFFINIAIAQNEPLFGKIIVIDPGHGGDKDTGAVGRTGYKESDLNLKVAIFLEELLKEKRANVILTRRTDAPCVIDSDPEELRARALVANNNNADLFISIHHNDMSGQGRYSANITEVYYRIMDDGPSLEFATILIKNLSKRVKSAKMRLSPANYAVLRHNTRPAVLGEANYISNPALEKLFKTTEFQKQEAMGYYESILEYFGKGVPYLDILNFLTPFGDIPLIMEADIKDPISTIVKAEAYVDDEKQIADFDGQKLKLKINTPLKSGFHSLVIKSRNSNGNSSIPFSYNFIISRPAVNFETEFIPSLLSPAYKGQIYIKTKITDVYDYPLADNIPVYFVIGDKGYLAKTLNGYAYCYPLIEDLTENLPIKINCQNISFQFVLNVQNTAKSSIIGFIKSQKTLMPVNNVKCILDKQFVTYSNPEGIFAYENLNSGSHVIETSCNGCKTQNYQFTVKEGELLNKEIQLESLYNGVLQGHKIMLDPIFSPDSIVNNANWEVTQKLKTLLEAGGANVIISRKDINEQLDILERIKLSMKFKPDLYYIISHEGTKFISHYYTSKGGQKLAGLAKKYSGSIKVLKSTDFMITHTPCPTLYISFGSVSSNFIKEAEILFKTTIEYYE